MSHRDPIKFSQWEIYGKVFTMGNLWESFHNGKSMGHVEHLSAGMGNLWYTLQNECPISMP